MKITIEIPDTTVCAFFDYVYYTDTDTHMAIKQIGTDDIRSGKVIVCDIAHPTKKGGVTDTNVGNKTEKGGGEQ